MSGHVNSNKSRGMKNPFEIEMVRIKKVVSEAPGLKTFTLDKKMDFKPGQFLLVSVLGMGESAISFSSYPDVQITINEVGNVTKALSRLKAGDMIGIRGPYGNSYPLGYLKGRNIYMITGGCGLAPVRSLIQYYEKNPKEAGSIHIFFGARSPGMIPFKKEIEQWKRMFFVYLTVDEGDESWKGNVGFVTSLLEKHDFMTNAAAVFCGPPAMFRFTADILKRKGFSDGDMIVSLERNMRCGMGECLHCNVGGKLVCKDGPVFRWSEVRGLE